MSRIRSIHPGLFSDEAYMAMSVWAKAAWPALWTECDDNGVFEWKPIVLKARIFPADNIAFEQLLEEWERSNSVRRFVEGGKTYGVVRNFRLYQRPKKPTYKHPLPDELRTYVGLTANGSEPVPHHDPTSTEKPPQMEEEGGRGEGKEESKKSSLRSDSSARAEKIAEDRSPTSADIEFAISQGFSRSEVPREWQKFRDYHRGKGTKSEDWSATWRLWVTKGADMLGRSPAPEPGNVAAIGFYAPAESPELLAWDDHNRMTKGTNLPRDRKGGWQVQSQWPPGHEGIPDFLKRTPTAA